MTIGTRTVSSLISNGYELLLLAVMAGFAIYDYRHKRVPNKALAFFLPIFLAAPFLRTAAQGLPGILPALLNALFGAGAGFGILLLAALLSKGGAGVGGGDIKLFAAIGLCFGADGAVIVFILTTLLSAAHFCILLMKKRIKVSERKPMVPYITVSSAIYLVILHEMSYNIMVSL